MADEVEIDSEKTPRAARLLQTVQVQTGARSPARAAAANVVPNRDARSLKVRKPDRTIRFPKPENALRQHAAEAKAAALAIPKIKISLKRPPAAQASAQPRPERSERNAAPSSQTTHTAAAGRSALGAVAELGVVAAIPTATQLGRLVRLRRADLGLSQVELAQRGAVGRRFVAELEAGKPSLELERTLNVCGAIGIRLFAVVEHDG